MANALDFQTYIENRWNKQALGNISLSNGVRTTFAKYKKWIAYFRQEDTDGYMWNSGLCVKLGEVIKNNMFDGLWDFEKLVLHSKKLAGKMKMQPKARNNKIVQNERPFHASIYHLMHDPCYKKIKITKKISNMAKEKYFRTNFIPLEIGFLWSNSLKNRIPT